MIALQDLNFVGRGLVRPECVLATRAGYYYVSDFRGGVTAISPSGQCQLFGGGALENLSDGQLKPNGICLLPDRSFLVAHLGAEQGGLYRVQRDGQISPFLLEVEGEALPPSNFVYLDHQGRLWFTVSTRKRPRADAYRADVADGFIGVIDNLDPSSARIVAENIGYTNELFVTPDGDTLYVNATFARETLAYRIQADNSLAERRIVGRYGAGIYPDGLTMDYEGQLWITSIVSNSVVKLDPQSGATTLALQDVNQAHLAWVEEAYLSNTMGRPHLDGVKSTRLHNISSLAFAGEQLDNWVMGCLLGEQVVTGKAPVRGLPPAHWLFDD